MTSSQWAWLAGLFEGEGCITFKKSGLSVVLKIKMADFDIIDRCHEITGVGRLHKRPPSIVGRKPLKIWTVGKKEDTLFILHGIRPWLGERRGQRADEAFERLEHCVSKAEVSARALKCGKLDCRQGEYLYIKPDGREICRACRRLRRERQRGYDYQRK